MRLKLEHAGQVNDVDQDDHHYAYMIHLCYLTPEILAYTLRCRTNWIVMINTYGDDGECMRNDTLRLKE